MRADLLVSVEEYLSTVYRPDCGYVDGILQERNVGEQDHSRLQMLLAARLFSMEETHGIRVLPEQRLQVRPNRFRAPDLCVLTGGKPEEQVLTRPPFLRLNRAAGCGPPPGSSGASP